MSDNIKTVAELIKESVMNQINDILKSNNMAFAPSVTITPSGMSFQINIIETGETIKVPTGGGGSIVHER